MSLRAAPEAIYLLPGELSIVKRPTVISTVLGSCVSVTLFHRRRGFGAMCHAMLPYARGGQDFKFVDNAVRHMLDAFDQQSIPRAEIEVKLFGGADMFDPALAGNSKLTVGRQNIAAAAQILAEEGLQLLASNVGGRQGRKLIFRAHTGEVLLKHLQPNLIPPPRHREQSP